VHHLAGHIESIVLEHGEIPLPAVILVVSGGHTSLYFVPEPGIYRLIGRTRDDAAGEAYDKVARLLGLGYPGGPIIDRLARDGDDQAVPLPRPKFTHPDRNAPPPDLMRAGPDLTKAGNAHIGEFSFSGLKTAVSRELASRGVPVATGLSEPHGASPLGPKDTADFCASFQRVVVETLVTQSFEALRAVGARSLGIAGGVSANSRLRRDAAIRGERDGIPVFLPALALSTDNAAMIAAAGLRILGRDGASSLAFNAEASLPISR
jgi:N6-L-threonylcarbamoyladenine synthase